mmetsp:Transcript_23807/g.33337  ORF Transcript_23807/g.33337 Transcript_23807/m.33337 type:complete len:177 (-) Transcript_23807:203-733(-)
MRLKLFPVLVALVSSASTKNIYGKDLEACPSAGSANYEGKCDEKGGGVHSLCVSSLPGDFGSQTGQFAWSQSYEGQRWCVCIGAWSNYIARNNFLAAKCDAIPDYVLGKGYIHHWNSWNAVSLPHQIVVGVNALYDQCKNIGGEELTHLKSKYCEVAEAYEQFKETDQYLDAGCSM